jgi:uncharacterized protein YndB with AHSA1/START domain
MPSATKKSATAMKRAAAAKKIAVTRKGRIAGRKAATPRPRKSARRKTATTRTGRATAAMSKAGMLIRRPVVEVFDAFVNPDITTKFWFTKSSGRLVVGTQVQWVWEMYGLSMPVTTKVVEPNKRIVITWPGYKKPTTVEWTFTSLEDGTTFVGIKESGFVGDGEHLRKQVASSTEGFSLVLAGLKAFLEHNVRLNLVADRFPKGIEE